MDVFRRRKRVVGFCGVEERRSDSFNEFGILLMGQHKYDVRVSNSCQTFQKVDGRLVLVESARAANHTADKKVGVVMLAIHAGYDVISPESASLDERGRF